MVSRSAILSSICGLVLFLGCDSPPRSDRQLPDGGTSQNSNAKPNPIITNNPDGPPDLFEMTPPTAADADATQQLKLIMRGMNVGNFLDATPQENSWSNDTLHTWFFEAIKEAGFDHVRIPVRWNAHTMSGAPDYAIDPSFFARVDWAIGHTLSRNMAAVLDIHHYDEYFANPAAEHDKFIALWKQIAEHYKSYPKNLFFEILNEPQKNVTAAIWNADMTEAVAEIRKSNPYRTLVIGGVGYNNIDQMSTVNYPAGDKNIIATYHYYNPYCFTIPPQVWDCQGRGWDNPYPHSGEIDQKVISWPVLFPADIPDDAGAEQVTANNEGLIDTAFAKAAAWSQTTGIPVYVGEFGADTYNRDEHARATYIGYVVKESEKYGFGWANWSLIHTFSAWNGNVGWYPEVIEAMTGFVPPS